MWALFVELRTIASALAAAFPLRGQQKISLRRPRITCLAESGGLPNNGAANSCLGFALRLVQPVRSGGGECGGSAAAPSFRNGMCANGAIDATASDHWSG